MTKIMLPKSKDSVIRKVPLLALLLILTLSSIINAQTESSTKTIVKDPAAKEKLLGPHRFSLQWISWDYFGKVNISDDNGMLVVKGDQRSRKDDDYLTIDGVITLVESREFKFNGTIITKVSHINNGQPCKRSGEMTFRITSNRKYWRLKEMDNPCEGVVDYVDIYFRQ
ncbi:MAG: hypothetical protein AB1489_25750 [Acidobacteriota bacterium]